MPADLCLQAVALHLEDHVVGLAAKQIGSSSQGYLSAPRSWWSNHLDCDLWPSPQTLFCTFTMPVHSHHRCIQHHVFHVRLIADCIKQLLKNISFDPVAKPLQDGAPLTKLGWQISPRATCSCNPKHCFQEESIVGATASSVSNLPQTQWTHTSPLSISQNISHHRDDCHVAAEIKDQISTNPSRTRASQPLHAAIGSPGPCVRADARTAAHQLQESSVEPEGSVHP